MDLTTLPGYVPGFSDDLGLRELGGLMSADGRYVRHGLFYRSSALYSLTELEKQRLDSFGLKCLIDLRGEGETDQRSDYVPERTQYLRLAGMFDDDGQEVDFSPTGIARLARHFEREGGDFIIRLYIAMTHDNPTMHSIVKFLVDNEVPLLFHCTAGKDRTGIVAATILMLLGVPDETIMNEFLLTNEYRAQIIAHPPHDLSPKEREEWPIINSVSSNGLQSVFDAIDERYSTREAYFKEEYGLDSLALEELRERYLV